MMGAYVVNLVFSMFLLRVSAGSSSCSVCTFVVGISFLMYLVDGVFGIVCSCVRIGSSAPVVFGGYSSAKWCSGLCMMVPVVASVVISMSGVSLWKLLFVFDMFLLNVVCEWLWRG